MKILLFGATERAKVCFELIGKSPDIEIVGAVLEPGKQGDAFEQAALANNVPVFYPKSFRPGKDGMNLLEELSPDLAVLCVYEKIVSKDFLDFFRARKGCINLHGGKVPEYRGSSVLRWQLIRGEKQGAFTILEVDEDMDTSAILDEYVYPLTEDMTIADVIKIEWKIFPKLLLETIRRIEQGTLEKKPQVGEPCYWHKRKEEDRRIRWRHMTAEQVRNLIRAETKPYAGAFCYLRQKGEKKKLRILEACHTTDQLYRGTPGRVARSMRDGSTVVICKDKGLLIKTISLDDEDPRLKVSGKHANELLRYRMQLY